MKLILAFLIGILVLPGTVSAQRIATVIANSEYERSNWRLENPVHDGLLMKEALEHVGFDVILITDADEDVMEAAFVEHGQRLKYAGKDAVGFFYYAGHGIESDGLNYLIPTDVDARTDADIWAQAPRLNLLLDSIKSAGNDTNFIVLDACRDNPLPRAYRSASGGLADAGRVRGTLIAYSTAPGTVAMDGVGSSNSPFARWLATYLEQPGLTAESLFRRVASAVELETGMAQQPWVESGLRGADFCFSGCGNNAVLSAQTESQALIAAFESSDLTLLRGILEGLSNTTSRSLVSARIDGLEAEQDAASRSAALPVGVASTDARFMPATMSAPIIDFDPVTLPDFALFKECETCPEMVALPAGTYLMGSDPAEPGHQSNEGPVVEVSLSRVAIARFETTQAQFLEYVEATGANLGDGCYFADERGRFKKYKSANARTPYKGMPTVDPGEQEKYEPNAPVLCTSWEDSQNYARYVSAKTPGVYRLPTEAEWEYGARGGTTTPYSFGSDGDKGCRYMNGADLELKRVTTDVVTTFCEDGFAATSPVGSLTPNAFGLFDMHGNVWEFTEDCETKGLDGQLANGAAKLKSNCSKRIARGGSWADNPFNLRSARRAGGNSTHRSIFTGYRMVRDLE